jgi:hypothetical protein
VEAEGKVELAINKIKSDRAKFQHR